jgi:hypothetical protein
VARDEDRHRIAGARRGHGPDTPGLPDLASQLPVGPHLAGWNALQLIPYADLKGRAAQRQGQLWGRSTPAPIIDAPDDFGTPRLQRIAGLGRRCGGQRRAQTADELGGIVAEAQVANATLTGGDEDVAQLAGRGRESDASGHGIS